MSEHSFGPLFGLVDVDVAGGDVVIAGDDQGRIGAVGRIQVAAQLLHPSDFVGALGVVHGGAVGHVDADHPQALDGAGDDPSLRAQSVVAQAERDVGDGRARQQGHAIIAFLPVNGRPVARRRQGLGGKVAVDHLGLLQAYHVGLLAAQPGDVAIRMRGL